MQFLHGRQRISAFVETADSAEKRAVGGALAPPDKTKERNITNA
jgi:hypothetical protein